MTPRVADALTAAAAVVGPAASLTEVAEVMAACGVEHLAVVGEGRLVGVVSAADLDAARPSPATTLTVPEIRAALGVIAVATVMREVPAVTFRTPLAEAARLMRDGDLAALPVVRDEAVVGVLTDLDLLTRLCEPGPETRP